MPLGAPDTRGLSEYIYLFVKRKCQDDLDKRNRTWFPFARSVWSRPINRQESLLYRWGVKLADMAQADLENKSLD